jgi:polyhydroxyalkanoate synthase
MLESRLPPGVLARRDPALWGRTVVQLAQGLVTHPAGAMRVVAGFAGDSTKIAAVTAARMAGGKIEGPMRPEKDARFTDTTWTENPFYFGLRQEYLALAKMLDNLVGAAGLDKDGSDRAGLIMNVVTSILSPTNMLSGNPSAIKRAFETGGSSVFKGLRNLIDDVVNNEGRPRQVDDSKLRVGQEMAATPGKVVFRNGLMELIQFQPQTETVHAIPILCSPPWINKYYIMDLRPRRSFIEWAVQHGHTVFVISYRNPDESMGSTSLEDYLVLGPRTALDVMCEITGSAKVNIVGLCLGGALVALLAALPSEQEADRINSLSLQNTLLDYSEVGPLSSFVHPEIIERLEANMAEKGYLDAGSMSGAFDLLRPNDLIFNYIGPNWLEGADPPAFDILAWNNDSTRMPAAMHSFYLRNFYLENRLVSGTLELCGEQLALKQVTMDTFIVAAEKDHIAPWRSSFSSTQMLGGNITFVLSTAGHIAGVVNPPSPKAKHWIGTDAISDPDTWRQQATEVKGSWWQTWAEWIGDRAGAMQTPPPMGSSTHPPIADAPGTYVRG